MGERALTPLGSDCDAIGFAAMAERALTPLGCAESPSPAGGEGRSCETGVGAFAAPAARVPCQSPSPPGVLAGDHLIIIREAVARSLEEDGLVSLANRTRAGELDTQPTMCAAMAAVSAVLKGMFE